MAWKFNKESVRDGDIVEPTEIRKNVNEFLGELNGYLDSDNLAKSALTRQLVKRNALTQVLFPKKNPAFVYVFDHQASGWVDRAKGRFNLEQSAYQPLVGEAIPSEYTDSDFGTEKTISFNFYNEEEFLPTIEFDSEDEGLVMVEFTGFVQWLPQVSEGRNKLTKYRNSARRVLEHEHQAWLDSLLTYGIASEPLLRAHNTQWLPGEDDGTSSIGSYGSNWMYPGAYGYWRMMETDTKSHQAFILCSMWRITVNGMSVAETGPIGNEYSCHPISLCGAIPIEAGKNNLIKVECQLVWYSPGLDQYKSSSSEDARLFNTALSSSSHMGTRIGPSCRIDCSLVNHHLFAIYRKR